MRMTVAPVAARRPCRALSGSLRAPPLRHRCAGKRPAAASLGMRGAEARTGGRASRRVGEGMSRGSHAPARAQGPWNNPANAIVGYAVDKTMEAFDDIDKGRKAS